MLTRYVLPFVAVCTLVFAITQMLKAQHKPPEVSPPIEPGKSPYVRQLAGAGIIEPETENIAIGAQLPGVVERVYIKVGQIVRPGDSLFQLDERQLRAELRARQALMQSAEASLAKLESPPRVEERPVNEAKVLESEVALRDATLQYDRVKRLNTTAISEDEQTKKYMAVELGKAQLQKAKADFKLWEAGAWKQDRLIAQAAVEQAQSQVNQTSTELSRLTTQAPHARWKLDSSGVEVPDDSNVQFKVLQVNIRPGEYINNMGATPHVVLGYVGQLHVRADLDENDISRFRPDLPGVAKPRGNPNIEYPLTFVRIEPYVIPKRSLTGANTERVDTRVLQVIYSINTKGDMLYIGQQVDVFINAQE